MNNKKINNLSIILINPKIHPFGNKDDIKIFWKYKDSITTQYFMSTPKRRISTLIKFKSIKSENI